VVEPEGHFVKVRFEMFLPNHPLTPKKIIGIGVMVNLPQLSMQG
jgi:hypothetical protein